eukprot:556219-Rhodomonas_salina.1
MPALPDRVGSLSWLSGHGYSSLFGKTPADDLKELMDAQPHTASVEVSTRKWKGGGRARGASARNSKPPSTADPSECTEPKLEVHGIDRREELGNYRMIMSILEAGEPRGARMLLSRLSHPSAMVRRAALDALESVWFLLAADTPSCSEVDESDSSSPPSSRP